MTLSRNATELIAMELRLLSSRQEAPVFFHGETMLPFLRDGDHLVVDPVAWEDLEHGDIIVYKYNDNFPARRVIRVRRSRRQVLVNGDNLPASVAFEVGAADILGKVTARERAGAWMTESDRAWRRTGRRAVRRARIARLFALFGFGGPRGGSRPA